MTTVYFATNRKKSGPGPRDYGAEMVAKAAANITYAVAEVDHVSLRDESSGTIASVHDVTMGDFSQAVKDRIVAANRDLLVFIHGADNSFDDAIKRAAFNREWFADTGHPAANTTVIAFTWPSNDKFFSLQHSPKESYKADQLQAGQSGGHLAGFLQAVAALRTALKTAHPTRRVFLLAHSMGNHALNAGVQAWFEAGGAGQQIFDQVLLAAADEFAGTFRLSNNGGLSGLPNLSDRISIYYSGRDRLLMLSEAVNHNHRLGFEGPDNMGDPALYPSEKFRIVDCTFVGDYFFDVPPDATHQYYRRSKMVREDIVACLVDSPRPDGGLIALEEPIFDDSTIA